MSCSHYGFLKDHLRSCFGAWPLGWLRSYRGDEVKVKPLVGKAGMHILVVEDDPVVADVLGMTF